MGKTPEEFMKVFDEHLTSENNSHGGVTVKAKSNCGSCTKEMCDGCATQPVEQRELTHCNPTNTDAEHFKALGKGDKATNVIYITTRCNLDCKYCYEREARNKEGFVHKDYTDRLMDEITKDIEFRESGMNSNFVLMGGEPMTRPDLVLKCLDKLYESNKLKGGGYAVNLVTNGTQIAMDPEIKEVVLEIFRRCKEYGIYLDFEISYDGSGHDLRVFAGTEESSKPYTEQAMDWLYEQRLPFCVSYTVTSANHDKIIPDLVYILERWGKMLTGICTGGYAYTELEANFNKHIMVKDSAGKTWVDKHKEAMKPYTHAMFEKYGVSICATTCDICRDCQPEEVANAYYSPGEGVQYAERISSKGYGEL